MSFRTRDELAPRVRSGLAACGLTGEQGIGINRRPLPPAVAGRHRVDREMEVRAVRTGVAGAADEPDHHAGSDLLALGETRGIAVEMRVIVHPAAVGRADVDGDPAAAIA